MSEHRVLRHVEFQRGFEAGQDSLRQRVAVLEELLEKVRQRCLFDDDDGQIGVSEDIVIDSALFDEICKALATTEGE